MKSTLWANNDLEYYRVKCNLNTIAHLRSTNAFNFPLQPLVRYNDKNQKILPWSWLVSNIRKISNRQNTIAFSHIFQLQWLLSYVCHLQTQTITCTHENTEFSMFRATWFIANLILTFIALYDKMNVPVPFEIAQWYSTVLYLPYININTIFKIDTRTFTKY